ncbi:MAG: triose-phosphate isomerase [Bacteroides sp.]|nr:MAG: triose-phosphate isomerase [Bacteroides sp.]
MMNNKILVGNLKMNLTYNKVYDLVQSIIDNNCLTNKNIIIACSYIDLLSLIDKFSIYKISFAAQNCSHKEIGAYTGEISAKMLSAINTKYVIIGHSERKNIFNESDDIVLQKLHLSLKNNLTPILCIGENDFLRRKNIHYNYIKSQIEYFLLNIDKYLMKKIIIAYEPVWAINSNIKIPYAEIQNMHIFIKKTIFSIFNHINMDNVKVIYGGNCNVENTPFILQEKDIDGVMVGRSSIDKNKINKLISLV